MRSSLFILLFIIYAPQIRAQLWLDENFTDWDDVIRFVDDIDDAPTTSQEILSLQLANDDEHLFLKLELADPINLQDQNNITVYIDTDNNSTTGLSISGIGADLSFNFGNRIGKAYFSNVTFDIFHNDIQLITLPTVTSETFEISIRKNSVVLGNPIQMQSDIRLVVKDGINGDQIPNTGSSILYTFNDDLNQLKTFSLNKQDDAYLRISSLNCRRDQIFDLALQQKFRRLFQATQPDIIAFQEIYDHSGLAVANLLDDWIPLPNGAKWQFDKVNPDIIVCSRYPIITSARIDGNGAFLLQFNDHPILIINVHLPCCGNDTERQMEVDHLMSFIRGSQNGISDIPVNTNTPIIILGDTNFVGDRGQRETITTGNIQNESTFGTDFLPDWDQSELETALLMQTGTPFAYTWINNFSSFGPGRLDFIFYTGSVLQLQNGFTLNTSTLDPNLRNQFGLLASDDTASDHLLITADFNLDVMTSTKEPVSSQTRLYPNPVHDMIHITSTLNAKHLSYQILNILGQPIDLAVIKDQANIQIDVSALTPGSYVLNIQWIQKTLSLPFIKI